MLKKKEIENEQLKNELSNNSRDDGENEHFNNENQFNFKINENVEELKKEVEEKNINLINNIIKYESKTARYHPMIKKKENIKKQDVSIEKENEKIISVTSNQKILKVYKNGERKKYKSYK